MENKKACFNIPVGIYSFNVIISIGQTDSELLKYLKRRKVNLEDEERWILMDNQDGVTVMFESKHILIRVHKFPVTPADFNTLHHEIFHAVSFILLAVEMGLSLDSNESYAYLTGYLTEEIYKKLKIKTCES